MVDKKIKLGSKIFLSHSSKDKKFVKILANRLKSDGFSVWYDDWEIHVGDSIVQRINDGISSSNFLLVVLSNNSVNSKWVKEELNAATIKNINKKGAVILPVLLEECEIPPLLSDKKYANFSTDSEFAYQELVEAINFHTHTIKNTESKSIESMSLEYSEIDTIEMLSKRSIKKINSDLKGEYEEYHLSDVEKNEFLKEIREIDNIALKAWNQKDYDTFQIAIEKLLWILTKIKNWPVIEDIRIRFEGTGWTVIKDARATNILLDSLRNVFSNISENKRGYPFKELIRDYRDLSIYIIQEGLLISSNHSLENYYQIGREVLKWEKEELAVTVLKDFYEIFSKADYNKFSDKGNVLTAIASIGVGCAKLSFRTATNVFLKIIMSNEFFESLFFPPFGILEIIEENARKQQWKEIIEICQNIKKVIRRN